jgi:hypothetical protein
LFDLRYHVASLAAVFLALIIGILVGVGIASQTSVSESDRKVFERQIADLQSSLDATRADADLLRRQQQAATDYIENRSYDAVMNGRLRGTKVAMVFLGQIEPGLRDAASRTVTDASGDQLLRRVSVELPIDAAAIRAALPPELQTLSLDDIGRRMGEELVDGGDQTPVSDALTPVLIQDQLGSTEIPADAVVVAQTALIGDGPTRRFVNGLYSGLAGSDVPAVGIERSDERPSRIATYKSHGLSTVDSVDTTLGRVGLAALLSGGQPGQYGLKSTATDGVTPVLEPLPLAPLPSG